MNALIDTQLLSNVFQSIHKTITNIISNSLPQPGSKLYKILSRLSLIEIEAQGRHPLVFAGWLKEGLEFFFRVFRECAGRKEVRTKEEPILRSLNNRNKSNSSSILPSSARRRARRRRKERAGVWRSS